MKAFLAVLKIDKNNERTVFVKADTIFLARLVAATKYSCPVLVKGPVADWDDRLESVQYYSMSKD